MLDVNRLRKIDLAKMVRTFVSHHNQQEFKELIRKIKERFLKTYHYLVEIHPLFCFTILPNLTIKRNH